MVERRRKKRTKADAHPLATSAKLAARAERRTRQRARESNDRERVTIHLPVALIERLRNAVYWTPGTTLTSVIGAALNDYIDGMEKARGDTFPQREGSIRLGRPPK